MKRARAARGTVPVTLRVPTTILKQIDSLASRGLVPATRTAVMLRVLEVGLASIERTKR